MNKRYGLLSIAAVVVIAATLFGSTYSQTQVSGHALSVSQPDKSALQQVRDMGGLNFVLQDAQAIPLDQVAVEQAAGRTVHQFNLTAQSVDLPVPGGTYHAMTFNGQVPAPTLRVTQGDVVVVTLTVPSSEPTGHSVDMHASQISAIPNFGAVMPGSSKTYAYIAETPGVFKYHCEGVNVLGMDQHVLSGMHGMVIVDPLNGYKKLLIERTATNNGQVVIDRQFFAPDALEFQLEYSQLYLTNGTYDQTKMFNHQPTWWTVNGMPFGYDPAITKTWVGKGGQYEAAPIKVPINQHIRFFIMNQADMPVYLHIVGSQIARVTQGNMVQAMGTQTWLVGGSQDAIMDVVFFEPGAYVVVNHDYSAIFSGAASVILAGNSTAANPSDAVPPDGKNSIHQDTFVHCLCTNDRAKELGMH